MDKSSVDHLERLRATLALHLPELEARRYVVSTR